MDMDNSKWKRNILLIGGILGAVTGLGAAYILIQRAEQTNTRPRLTAGEGVKVGLSLLSLLRLLTEPGKN